jgi:MoaA/NifB/PqqE/SkfB family radical SAM enzyme
MRLKNSLKILKLLGDIALANFKRLSFPYRLILALTYRCNLRCKTCLIWAKPEVPELNLCDLKLFFRESNTFSWIDLTGGEISLRDDLQEIIDLILNACHRLLVLHFPTNGQLPEKIIPLAERIRSTSKVELIVTVSLDGPEAIHDEIRGVKNSWRRALDTFVGLKKIGLKRAYLGYTLSPYNIAKIGPMLKEVKDAYPAVTINDLHINFFHRSAHYLNNASLEALPEPILLESAKEIYAWKKQYGIKNALEERYFTLLPRFVQSRQIPLRCQALSSSVFIDAQGDIYPCTIFNQKIGNIKEKTFSLRQLWRGPLATQTYAAVLGKKCPGCWTPCEAYPAIAGSFLRRDK